VAINDHEPSVHTANTTHLQWTMANSNMPLNLGMAATPLKNKKSQFL
jgi:hypothetical protein